METHTHTHTTLMWRVATVPPANAHKSSASAPTFRSDRKEGGKGGSWPTGRLADWPAVRRRSLMDGGGRGIKNACEPMKAVGKHITHGGCHASLRLIEAPPPSTAG